MTDNSADKNMNTLYTYGYQMGAKVDTVAAAVEGRDWVLVDTRLKPASNKPEWNKSHLVKVLGWRYRHIEALGNTNYKHGGEIALKDVKGGIRDLLHIMEDKPVVLMCGCWDTANCHRTFIANKVKYISACEVVHLTRENMEAWAVEHPARQRQMSLFE